MKNKAIVIANTAVYDDNLCESDQRNDIKMALSVIGSNKIERLTPWALCRDFFTDTLLAGAYNVTHKIYGYTARPADIRFNGFLMRLRGDNELCDASSLVHNLPLLREFERELGWKMTTLHKASPELLYGTLLTCKHYALRLRAPEWRSTSWALHCYTLLLKTLWNKGFSKYHSMRYAWEDGFVEMTHDDGYGQCEKNYLNTMSEKITYDQFVKMLSNSPKINEFMGNLPVYNGLDFDDYDADDDSSDDEDWGEDAQNEHSNELFHEIHDNYGIVSIIDKYARGLRDPTYLTKAEYFPRGMQPILLKLKELS